MTAVDTEAAAMSLVTLTHARLRAEQGDRAGARRLLDLFLTREPGNSEARGLLEALGDRPSTPTAACVEQRPDPPQPGDPAALSWTFRRLLAGAGPEPGHTVARLEGWLRRIRGGTASKAQ